MVVVSEHSTDSVEVEDSSICPQCGGRNIILDYEMGERTCGDCGLVIGAIEVSRGPDWKAYTLEESYSRARAGPADLDALMDFPGHGLNARRDGVGRFLSEDATRTARRLEAAAKGCVAADSKARNLKIARKALRLIVEKMSLPAAFEEEAIKIYIRALKKDLIRGRTIEGFVGASVYSVIRMRDVPRTLEEVGGVIGMDVKALRRCYGHLVGEFKFKMPINHPMKYVAKLRSSLEFDWEVEQKARDYLNLAWERNILQGKNPKGMAVAAVYKACVDCGIRFPQKKVAKSLGVSDVTLRIRLKDLDSLSHSHTDLH